MNGFSVGKILLGLRNPELYLRKLHQGNINTGVSNNSAGFNSALNKSEIIQNMQQNPVNIQPLPMNQIASMDRAVYIRNLLGLPQTLGEILLTVQNKNTPINTNTLMINDLNQDLLKNQKVLSQIFDETSEAQINPAVTQNPVLTPEAIQKDAVILFFSGMIRMGEVSKVIQQNSKQALAGLIIALSSATQKGLQSEQIRETMAIINSCVSMASSDNPAQTLKSLMLLYLPWLPLNEGVGFDLEIESTAGENESNNSKLVVLIQTRNYGNIKGEFVLTTQNSVEVFITCPEGFPKKTLQKSLMDESSSHAMNTTVDVEAVQPKNQEMQLNQEAKVNLSATNEMNPYLLLMAHAFIRNTIFIDTNSIVEDDE